MWRNAETRKHVHTAQCWSLYSWTICAAASLLTPPVQYVVVITRPVLESAKLKQCIIIDSWIFRLHPSRTFTLFMECDELRNKQWMTSSHEGKSGEESRSRGRDASGFSVPVVPMAEGRLTWCTQSRNWRKMGVKPLPWLLGFRLLLWLNLWPKESHSFSKRTWKPSRVR